jgi:two-component system, OmpR family, phosphate regulon response regulator PhoB
MTRILLVEDDQSLGATLKERLSKEGYEVVWAGSKAESLKAAEAGAFDLYIFDVGLPDGNGFELARELPPKPFLFLTAQGDAESRLHGYELGAEEYIPKPFHLRELLLRVKHVIENHARALKLKIGDVSVDFESYTFERGGKPETVASKDLMFLKMLVEMSPKVLSRDSALNELWGEDKFPSNRSVDNAVLRLRTALGEQVAECIESVRGVGYRWNPGNVGKKS